MKRTHARWAILSLALLGCALLPRIAEAAAVRAPLQQPNARKAAPNFNLLDASGKTIRLSDYRGRVAVLNFWATECGGCRLEILSFVELHQAYQRSGVVVVGVSMDILYESLKNADQAWSLVKPFVQAHRIDYPILMGNDEVTKLYDIQALPLTHLIDANGRIAATYLGVVDTKDVEANIKVLLRER